MWNKIKKFLIAPSDVDKERVERCKDTTSTDAKLTIEHNDKAVNYPTRVTMFFYCICNNQNQ